MRFALLFLFFLTACGPGLSSQTGNNSVWLPWPDSQGDYKWQTVELLSRSNPHELDSGDVQVYWRAGGKGSGFSGHRARPRTMKAGDHYVATDTASLMSLTAFAVFERIARFDRKLGVAHALTWPRQVGVDIEVKTQLGRMESNALYDPILDVIAMAPFRVGGSLPAALNHGILAHEHFHAHFSHSLRRAGLDWVFKNFAQSEVPLSTLVDTVSLLALNEGLADFYAYAFTRDPSFMRSTFTAATIARQLNAAYAVRPLMTRQEITQSLQDRSTKNIRTQIDLYAEGSKVSRFLYRWSEQLGGPDVLVGSIIQTLPEILLKLKNESILQDHFAIADFLVEFLAISPARLPPSLCKEAKILTTRSLLRDCP